MIPKELSEQIVVAGISPDGKGGVSSVIASQRNMLEIFNFVKISGSGLSKFYQPFVALFSSLKFLSKKYKAVHLHTSSYKDFYRNTPFVYLYKLMGKKVLLHIHGAKFDEFTESKRGFVKTVCNKADGLIGVSSYFVKFFKDNNLNENVYLLHNGIDAVEEDIVRKESDGDITVFSYFGALDDRKGIFDVVETIGLNKELFDGKILFYIGGKGDVERLTKLIEKYDLKEIVKFLGWLDAQKKSELLLKTDVFIHPSSFESFGISILEAMNYGLPVITTKIGGIPDLVKNGENGLFVGVGNKDDIRDAMLKLSSDKKMRHEMGEKSSLYAKEFGFPKIERKLEGIYQDILKD